MPKECLKCGHINEADAPLDLIECPKCTVIYEKYEAAIAPKALKLNISVDEYARDIRRAEAERRQRAADVQSEREAQQLTKLEEKRDADRQTAVKPTVQEKETLSSPTLRTAPCRTCGGLVAIGAKACPHCGQTKPAPEPPIQKGAVSMGLKTSCDRCGQVVLGITHSLKLVNGQYLCPQCVGNPAGTAKYYCNACHNFNPVGLKKGNGWIELVLYFFYILPGVIYSIWRRSGPPTVCPLCRASALVPAAVANPLTSPRSESRDEVECPYCAEKILARAKVCKHCGKEVRV